MYALIIPASSSLAVKKRKSRKISQKICKTREGKVPCIWTIIKLFGPEVSAVLMDNSPGVYTYATVIDFMITHLPVECITEDEQNLNAEIS